MARIGISYTTSNFLEMPEVEEVTAEEYGLTASYENHDLKTGETSNYRTTFEQPHSSLQSTTVIA